jgi:putative endonuclease
MSNLQQIGAIGEDYVARYIQKYGGVIIDRNWRIKEGEVDIIARHDGTLVFIEVKTRTTGKFGHPLEAIDRNKAFRLQRLALAWISLHGSWGSDYRIDCAAVLLGKGENVEIDYRRGVL